MQLAVSTSQSHVMMRRRKNVWYSVRDGNWEDPTVWVSNALDKKTTICPQYGDEVHVMHTIDYNNSLISGTYTNNPVVLYNYTISNLFVHTNGKLTSTRGGNQMRLVLNGNLYCDGTIDYSGAISPVTLWLNTHLNYINTFIAGTKSTILYNSPYDFAIMPITYYNLEIANTGTKTATANLTVNGTFSMDGQAVLGSNVFELGTFDATFNIVSLQGKLSKSGSGTVNFNGNLSFGGVGGQIVFNTGNPTVNIAGGISSSDTRFGINFGSTVNITTTQTWSFTASSNVPSSIGTGNFLIGSGAILTIDSPSGAGSNNGGWINKGTVNGVDGTSTLLIDGTYGYGNANVAMATGVLNLNHSGNSNIFVDSGVTMTLPATSFYDLTTNGTVTIAGNTTVSHNFNLNNGSLQLSTFDFTVSGTMNYSGALNKSGGGTVNLFNCNNLASLGSIAFSGSPTVNLTGNFGGDCRTGINFGSNPLNVNANVTFTINGSGNNAPAMAISILIASGKTLINAGANATQGGLNTTGTITGADATAIFDNRSVLTCNNATAPMATGKLYANQAANTVIYGLAGNQDIITPSDPSTPGYKNLTLQGSGAKRLLGNVSVKGTYTLTAPATLNSNGFSLTNP